MSIPDERYARELFSLDISVNLELDEPRGPMGELKEAGAPPSAGDCGGFFFASSSTPVSCGCPTLLASRASIPEAPPNKSVPARGLPAAMGLSRARGFPEVTVPNFGIAVLERSVLSSVSSRGPPRGAFRSIGGVKGARSETEGGSEGASVGPELSGSPATLGRLDPRVEGFRVLTSPRTVGS